MLVAGIDEAGRGPLIGPMVMAGILIDEKDVDKLKAIGVKDSKLLSQKQREILYKKIIEIVHDYNIVVVEPAEIDETLASADSNLNWLEAQKTAIILNELKPDKAIVDAPSNNIKAYEDYLRNLLKKDMKLVVEHKADLNYVESGAASILAKVTREEEIAVMKKKVGDFGSGYPSDPKTQEFLKKYHNKYPDIFRKSWATYKKVAGQKGLDEY